MDGFGLKLPGKPHLATATELRLEFLHASRRVDEALLTGICRVGVCSDVANHDLVLNTVDDLFFASPHRGTGNELVPGGDVDEDDRIQFGMNFSFHSRFLSVFSPDAP